MYRGDKEELVHKPFCETDVIDVILVSFGVAILPGFVRIFTSLNERFNLGFGNLDVLKCYMVRNFSRVDTKQLEGCSTNERRTDCPAKNLTAKTYEREGSSALTNVADVQVK
jgi:hypothetical protein